MLDFTIYRPTFGNSSDGNVYTVWEWGIDTNGNSRGAWEQSLLLSKYLSSNNVVRTRVSACGWTNIRWFLGEAIRSSKTMFTVLVLGRAYFTYRGRRGYLLNPIALLGYLPLGQSIEMLKTRIIWRSYPKIKWCLLRLLASTSEALVNADVYRTLAIRVSRITECM